jgi:hypothetical protein
LVDAGGARGPHDRGGVRRDGRGVAGINVAEPIDRADDALWCPYDER